MSQEVMIAGALFEDVPSIKVPDSDNVYHSFLDTSDATATAANILQGYTAYVNGELITGTASGGVTNVVTGTFTGTTTGAALTVPLNYTGSGFPLAAIVFPAEGAYNAEGDFYNTLHANAFDIFAIVKCYPDTPTYTTSGNNNAAVTTVYLKSSSSDPTSMKWVQSTSANTFSSNNATSSSATGVRFKSSTEMSVFIASTRLGFLANTPYQYCVLYSS